MKLKKGDLAGDIKGMALPFTPTGVSFKSICYKVPMPVGADGEHLRGEGVPLSHLSHRNSYMPSPLPSGYNEAKAAGQEPELVLLTEITGSFRPGVLTALMGVSGAGKVSGMGREHISGVQTASNHEQCMHALTKYILIYTLHPHLCGYYQSDNPDGRPRWPQDRRDHLGCVVPCDIWSKGSNSSNLSCKPCNNLLLCTAGDIRVNGFSKNQSTFASIAGCESPPLFQHSCYGGC